MGRYWDYYPRYSSQPRLEAKDGIKAKSRRGDIGETWWSKRFVAVLESFRMGARMSRGRSYARSGQVMDLKVAPGEVTARVQGTRRGAYRVRIGVRTLPEADWRRVEDAMAEQAIFMARLLAGEMPEEIEEAFAACKLSPFPASTRDLETSCTCPDWANPCKHIAATYYILAERFDEDPFLIFAWRGRTKEDLLSRLRTLRGASGGSGSAAVREEDEGAPLGEPAAFWTLGASIEDLRLRPQAATVPDALVRELGPLGVEVGGADAAGLLRRVYVTFTRAAERRAFAGE